MLTQVSELTVKALCKLHRSVDIADGEQCHGGVKAAKHQPGPGALVQPKALAVVDVDGNACKECKEAELQYQPRQLYLCANVDNCRVGHRKQAATGALNEKSDGITACATQGCCLGL